MVITSLLFSAYDDLFTWALALAHKRGFYIQALRSACLEVAIQNQYHHGIALLLEMGATVPIRNQDGKPRRAPSAADIKGLLNHEVLYPQTHQSIKDRIEQPSDNWHEDAIKVLLEPTQWQTYREQTAEPVTSEKPPTQSCDGGGGAAK